MRFSLLPFICTSIFTTSALAAVLPTERLSLTKRDACSAGGMAPVHIVGGHGGTYFCENRLQSSGDVLSGLEVWSGNKGIFGIQLTFSSGNNSMYGHQGDEKSESLKLEPGELVQSARLWGNGKGQHLGHIYIKTDKHEFDVGMPKPNDGYAIDVGGGQLLGAEGYAGDKYLQNLAFLFLKAKIDRIEIGDIHFDPDPTGTSTNIAPVYIIDSTFGNPSNSTVPFSVAGAEAVATSTTWEQTTTGKFGMSMSVEVEAKPFGVGTKTTGGFEWSVEDSTSKATTKTDTITLTNTVGPMQLQPGQGKQCQIVAQRGDGNFPYTSTVTLKLADGSDVSYQETGELKTVQYSEVKASCVDVNQPIKWEGTLKNPPKGVTAG